MCSQVCVCALRDVRFAQSHPKSKLRWDRRARASLPTPAIASTKTKHQHYNARNTRISRTGIRRNDATQSASGERGVRGARVGWGKWGQRRRRKRVSVSGSLWCVCVCVCVRVPAFNVTIAAGCHYCHSSRTQNCTIHLVK